MQLFTENNFFVGGTANGCGNPSLWSKYKSSFSLPLQIIQFTPSSWTLQKFLLQRLKCSCPEPYYEMQRFTENNFFVDATANGCGNPSLWKKYKSSFSLPLQIKSIHSVKLDITKIYTATTQMQLSGALLRDAAEHGEQLLCWSRSKRMRESFVMEEIHLQLNSQE